MLSMLTLLLTAPFTHVSAQQVFTEQGVAIEFSVTSKAVDRPPARSLAETVGAYRQAEHQILFAK